MPNIENVRDEPITAGPQADQVEPHERGAEAIAQTAYRTDRYFSQVASDIKGLAQPGAVYVENLTRAQAATSMATESQTDMQAMEGAKKAFADDIQSDTHDPQLAMNLRNTYAKVVQAGATGFSTQEGKEQYIARADNRLRAFSDHLVNLEGQAASAQSVIDFSRHEDGLIGQAQMGGTAILPSLDQQITAFTSNLNNSTPEAAATNALHGRELGLKVSMAAVESDLNALPADQDPMAAAEKIIAGDPTRFAPLANEIRQAAKGVFAERQEQIRAAKEQAKSNAEDKSSGYMTDIYNDVPGTLTKAINDPNLSREEKSALTGYADTHSRLEAAGDPVVQSRNYNTAMDAALNGKLTDPLQLGKFVAARQLTEEQGKFIMDIMKVKKGTADFKLPPGASTDLLAAREYWKSNLVHGPGDANGSQSLADATNTYTNMFMTGLREGKDPNALLDTTGTNPDSIYKKFPLSNFRGGAYRSNSAPHPAAAAARKAPSIDDLRAIAGLH